MKEILKTKIILVGEQQGDIEEFDTCWKAYERYQEIKDFDKRNHILDKYTFEFRYTYKDEPNIEYTKGMKIYRRRNKLFYKFI